MKNCSILCFLFTLFLLPLQAQNNDVMIQGFNWESHSNTNGWYNVVASKATDLGNSGIDLIWMPPPSDAAAPQGYLPRKLYDLNTEYGTQAELQAAINALHNENIKVVADIVINHRVGVTNWADFEQPTWGCWGVTAGDEWGANGGTPCGNNDTGDNYSAARDIDHTNATVQSDISAWMNWLKNTIGFDGWRYDYVRGYSGYYNSVYNNATNAYFSVGELWDNLDINNYDPHRQQLADWVNSTQATSTVFDFTTKGILQQAVQGELWRLSNNGSAPGLIGWWPGQSVTFVDNHDTGSTQNYWPFPGDKVMQGYAYILTHPGIPTVFWDHFYDWGLHDEIADLIAARKDNGINSESSLDIKIANWDVYAAEIDGKIAMKIGPGSWSPQGNDWTLRTFGTNYAVWEKSTPPPCTEALTIHFKKPNNWGSATMYYWNPSPSGDAVNWPGVAMQSDGNGWYSYTIDCADCANIIFSDNGANQSADLSRCDEGWYDGSWHNSNPDGGGGNSLTVHFRPNGFSNPSIYFWGVTPSGASTSWPGVAMQAEGNGWYQYTFENTDCANFIFSTNGGNQTADLYSCSEYWYENGAGYNSVDAEEITASAIQLSAFPNPARDYTTIEFNLPEAMDIQLEVYTLTGQQIQTLATGNQPEGIQQFMLETSTMANGVYLYRLTAKGAVFTQRFVISR